MKTESISHDEFREFEQSKANYTSFIQAEQVKDLLESTINGNSGELEIAEEIDPDESVVYSFAAYHRVEPTNQGEVGHKITYVFDTPEGPEMGTVVSGDEIYETVRGLIR